MRSVIILEEGFEKCQKELWKWVKMGENGGKWPETHGGQQPRKKGGKTAGNGRVM